MINPINEIITLKILSSRACSNAFITLSEIQHQTKQTKGIAKAMTPMLIASHSCVSVLEFCKYL